MAKKKKIARFVLFRSKIKQLQEGIIENLDSWSTSHFKLKISILSFLLLILVVLAANSLTNDSLSANFADDVLRPLIGSQRTVALESVMFNVSDFLDRYFIFKIVTPNIQYSTNLPKDPDVATPAASEMRLVKVNDNDNSFLPLSGEGEWKSIPLVQFPDQTVMASTFVRTDPQRPYAIVTLVKINMRKLNLGVVAGTKEPGGVMKNFGPGKVPANIQSSGALVGAFNGGFQARDGQYGMVVDNRIYLPLKTGLATLGIDKNHNVSIFPYGVQSMSNYLALRQNGDMLVQNSQIVPLEGDQQYNVWGRTVTNSMYTWRSGVGVTVDGDLIYAVGPSLVPATLAKALAEAGAVNALQLDINPYWVRFVIFNPTGLGTYTHYSLLKDMYDGGKDYLSGYQKDFFYLYKK